MSRADRDAYHAEMQAAPSEWKSSMKADRDAYRADNRSARTDWSTRAKASSAPQRSESRSARSDWSTSTKASSAPQRSDSYTTTSTTTSHRSDSPSVLANDMYVSAKAAKREASRSELQYTSSVSSITSKDKDAKTSESVASWQYSDDIKSDWNKLKEYGKAKTNEMYAKSKEVHFRAMTKDPCDCQLKDFYTCVDEEGSNNEKCRLFMEKLFDCRKNLKKANFQTQ